MAAETLVPVKADKAVDFVTAGSKAMGGKSLGETTAKFDPPKYTLDPKTKTIKKVTVKFTITIRRAHYAGQVKEKPDADNLKAINEAESLNKAHEEAHRDGYQKVYDDAGLEKAVIGKTQKEANALFKKLSADLNDACEKLHKSGGLVTITETGGKITVKKVRKAPAAANEPSARPAERVHPTTPRVVCASASPRPTLPGHLGR